jgi:hypothetical protein
VLAIPLPEQTEPGQLAKLSEGVQAANRVIGLADRRNRIRILFGYLEGPF